MQSISRELGGLETWCGANNNAPGLEICVMIIWANFEFCWEQSIFNLHRIVYISRTGGPENWCWAYCKLPFHLDVSVHNILLIRRIVALTGDHGLDWGSSLDDAHGTATIDLFTGLNFDVYLLVTDFNFSLRSYIYSVWHEVFKAGSHRVSIKSPKPGGPNEIPVAKCHTCIYRDNFPKITVAIRSHWPPGTLMYFYYMKHMVPLAWIRCPREHC